MYVVGTFCNVLLSSSSPSLADAEAREWPDADFAALCSITIMMRWPLFWRESREQWNFCREFLPLFGNIFSCFMKRCRGKFLEGTPAVTKKRSGYISIIQLSCVKLNHKERRGGGTTKKKNEELLGFFLELIYPMFCRVLHYCISDWIEGMKVLLHTQSLDQALA